METQTPDKENINKDIVPDFIEENNDKDSLHKDKITAHEQESFPELGRQTITGSATDNSDMETEPEDDGDHSIIGPKD
ncbi:hypothetical protein GCM10023149_28990 [Mucilaginibacter gynuensis]|uniref:Uncharacterized protein n=1 Tax=Mucilaginibacter gynuensis TaxID=1302236 RepID=A0ABP8GLL0_9SPHI